MSVHTTTEYEIETASGLYVDVMNPRPATIALEDVAHALAHTCRFGGHTGRFYSVAEHACLVARKVHHEGGPELALAALHHDDHEAYIGDVPRPIKLLLRRMTAANDPEWSWGDVERDLDYAIAQALGWREDGPDLFRSDQFAAPLVKDADLWALMCEARALLPSRGEDWVVPGAPPVRWPLEDLRLGLVPKAARDGWLALHHEWAR